MVTDRGFTVERAMDGFRAAQCLVVTAGPGNRRGAEATERWWEDQVKFAEKAGRHDPPK